MVNQQRNGRLCFWAGLVAPILGSLFFAIGLSACETEESMPLEEDKLVQVLADIHTGEAALGQLTGNVKDTAAHQLYEQIYFIHDVSPEEVDSSLAILKKSPEKMEKIYEKVMEELEKMKNEPE